MRDKDKKREKSKKKLLSDNVRNIDQILILIGIFEKKELPTFPHKTHEGYMKIPLVDFLSWNVVAITGCITLWVVG